MIIQVRQEGDDDGENVEFYEAIDAKVRGRLVTFHVATSPDTYEVDTVGWHFDGNSLLLVEAKDEDSDS